jgi:mRNA-degrading endonuclease YafQ of YafQ-DinJ toxin-antitoxin module
MTGIESWRKLDTDLLNSTSIDTIGKMAGCPGNFTDAPGDYKLDRLPDQETINEAFTVFYNNVEKHGLEDPFQKLMFSILKKLIKTKKLDQGRFQKCIRIILDGTNFATFKKRHCEHCLTQTHIVDGKEVTYYMHKALVAIVMITEDIGIPIAVEFIENENPDVSKQDCENKAAKRLLRKLRKEFPRVRFMVQGDALYGVKPLLDLCTEYDWLAAFTVKETTQKTMVQEFVSNYDNPGMEDEYTIVENVLRTKKGNNEHGTLIFRNGLEGFLPERKGRKVKDRNSGDGEAVPIVSSKISMMVYAHQVPIGSEEDEYYKTMNQKEQESENNADLSTAMASMAQNLAARSTEMLLQDHAVQKKWKGVKKENLKVLYFAWIYNFDIRKEFAEESVRVGRGRWKIETTFFTQKHGSLRLEHVWCREYGAMKMHFWLIQLADLIQTLHMLYDLAASQAYSCYKDFVKELARSFTRDSLDAPGIREFIVKRRKMFKHTG